CAGVWRCRGCRRGGAGGGAPPPGGWGAPDGEQVLEALGYAVSCTSRVGWWHPGDRPLAVPRIAVRRGMQPGDFAAIVDGAPRSLWGMQAVEAAKNAAKACLGHGGGQCLRAPRRSLGERV